MSDEDNKLISEDEVENQRAELTDNTDGKTTKRNVVVVHLL